MNFTVLLIDHNASLSRNVATMLSGIILEVRVYDESIISSWTNRVWKGIYHQRIRLLKTKQPSQSSIAPVGDTVQLSFKFLFCLKYSRLTDVVGWCPIYCLRCLPWTRLSIRTSKNKRTESGVNHQPFLDQLILRKVRNLGNINKH